MCCCYVGTVPPSAEKYRKEAIDYYNLFLKDLDALIKLGNEQQLAKAQAKADAVIKAMPPVLFKK